MKNFIVDIFNKYKKYISYIFFGALTTAVYFIFYYACRWISFSQLPSTVIAWFFSVVFAFITNKLFVFESKTNGIKQLAVEILSFFGSRIFSLLVDTLITAFFTYTLHYTSGLKELFGKIVANIVVLILNFVLSQFLVFRNKKSKESE